MRGTLIAIVMVSLALSSSAAQSPVTAFKGRPSMKISEGGVERPKTSRPTERSTNRRTRRSHGNIADQNGVVCRCVNGRSPHAAPDGGPDNFGDGRS